MMTGVIVAVVALVAATAVGLVWRRRNGVLRPRADSGPVEESAELGAQDHAMLSAEDLDAPLGARATLVQFSSTFCASCRATRQILGDVSGMLDGVRYAEIDAESHLDLVRRLGVLRTPTVLVLDADGRIVRRGSGRPRKADVIAALGDLVGDPSHSGVSPDWPADGGYLSTLDGETDVTGGETPFSIMSVRNWTEQLLTKRRAVDFCRVATALCPMA